MKTVFRTVLVQYIYSKYEIYGQVPASPA